MASREFGHSHKTKERQRYQVTVNPEPASDTGTLRNMLGYFQEYISQGYTNKKEEKRETVLWAHLETAETNGVSVECHKGGDDLSQPLLLVLGLTSGYSVWIITLGSEARMVYSYNERVGVGRVVRLLKMPDQETDLYREHRPIMSVVNRSSDSSSTMVFVSLRSKAKDDNGGGGGLEVKKLRFEKKTILDVCSNRRYIIVQLPKRVVVLDAGSFEQKYTIKNCDQPLPEFWSNPVALGSQWLALTSNKVHSHLLSQGGMSSFVSAPVTSTVVNTVKKGFAALTDTISGLTARVQHGGGAAESDGAASELSTPVSVTTLSVVDLGHPHTGEVHLGQKRNGDGVIAHFLAHINAGVHITALSFNNSGELLFCADSEGQLFHVFRILASAHSSSHTTIQHLYALHRGSTAAQVQDVCFSNDSRWVAVSTLNGTTHLFPISPYGGEITVRTHTASRVVNQHSRFHTSAGIHGQPHHHHQSHSPPTSSITTPPAPSASLATSSLVNHSLTRSLTTADSTDNLSPGQPVTIYPLLQIKQPYLPASTKGSGSDEGQVENTSVCVRAVFAVPADNNTTATIEPQDQGVVYHLSVLGAFGVLTEHCIVPQKLSTANDGDDAPIEVLHSPKMCWKLLSSSLESDHSLLPLDEENLSILTNNHSVINNMDTWTTAGAGGEWLSQVETLTHTPPTRRLWMGPQFSFRTVTNTSNSPDHLREVEDEEEEDTAVLSPTHDLSDLLDICELHTNTSPLTAAERDSNTDPAVDSGVEVFGSWKDIAPHMKSPRQDTELQQQLIEAMSEQGREGMQFITNSY